MAMSTPNQISEIWDQAVVRYEKITGTALDTTSLERVTTVDDLLRSIEAENKAFSDFRAHRSRLFNVLKAAMLPLEAAGDILSAGVAIAFPPAALIFGSIKHVICAAKGVSAKYDAIFELMTTIKDFTVRLEIYVQQELSESLRQKLTDILITLLEIFAISRQNIDRRRLRAFGKNLLLGNDEGKEMLERLNYLTSSEQSLVGAVTLSEVKAANTVINRVDSNIVHLANRLSDMSLAQMQSIMRAEQAQELGNRERVKSVLQATTSADDKYSAINRSRVSGTGDWIQEERGFAEWMSRLTPILWVTGNPGAGKTYIASNIISHLKKHFPQNVQHPSRVSVGYFFFKDDNLKTRSVHQGLRDVAFKIAQNDPIYANHIASCVDSSEDIETLASVWQKLYRDFFIENEALDNSVYIVLDALDEAFTDDRLELFELVKDLQQGGRLQLLMLGRPHIVEEMDEIMDLLGAPTIFISDQNNSNDIVWYIKSSISKSVYLKRASKTLQEEIIKSLSTGAQGMFLWVDFMLKELLKKRDEASMRKVLLEAPKGLSRMIRHVLISLSESMRDSPSYADDLNEMLAWVTCARWPLNLHEMELVLQWRSQDGTGWIWLEGSLRRQFASFFQLNRQDGLTTAELQRAAAIGSSGMNYDMSDEGFEDLDNQADFNSDPTTTDITFTHASLGDFFRNECEGGGSAGAEGCPVIGIHYHEAKVLVFKRFFEIISGTEEPRKGHIANALLLRACPSIIAALEVIDINQCSKEDKQTIGLCVARLLSTESIVGILAANTGEMIHPHRVLGLFMKWLSDRDVQECLPSEEKQWYEQSTAESNLDIFLPCIRYVAKQWLRNSWWNGHKCCEFIRYYLHLRGHAAAPFLDSADVVIETAEWCQLEKDTLWYRRVAMALHTLGFLDTSIEYFEKAVHLGQAPHSWLSRAGMASVYAAKKDYTTALELNERCLTDLEQGTSGRQKDSDVHAVYESLGLCCDRLGNPERGASLYQKGLRYSDRCNNCIRTILGYLNINERYEESMSFLKEMDEVIPDQEVTRLSEILMANPELSNKFTSWFSAAAYRTSNASYIIYSYARAAIAARNSRKSVQAANLELCLGVLHQYFGRDPSRAANIWEHLINTYRGTRAEGDIISVLETASNHLATHYFTHATEIGISTPEGVRYGEMLERLAQGKALLPTDNLISLPPIPRQSREARFVTNSVVGLVLGNFYKISNRTNEAKSCYTAQVGEVIRLLSDSDPSNDSVAFLRLASILAAAGDDDENAASMWHQSQALSLQRDFSGDESIDSKDGSFPRLLTCSACYRFAELCSLSICRYCYDVRFCESCVTLLQDGNHPVKICGQKHEWIPVGAPPQAHQQHSRKPLDTVVWNGDAIHIDELKRELRKQWGIEEKQRADGKRRTQQK